MIRASKSHSKSAENVISNANGTALAIRPPRHLVAQDLRQNIRLTPFKASARLQVVEEFRAKLKTVEDLISKLAFSLREIQGSKDKKSKDKAEKSRARVLALDPF